MKSIKINLAIIGAVVLSVLFAPSAFASTCTIGNLKYSLTDYTSTNGTAQVVGPVSKSALTELVIPRRFTYAGRSYSVGAIQSSAFADCINLKTITLPDGIGINESAFSGCVSLTSVTIPKPDTNAPSISRNAFYGCSNLKTVVIEGDFGSIGNNAFTGTNLTTIVFGGRTTLNHTISASAFQGCDNLKAVWISENLTKMDKNTPYGQVLTLCAGEVVTPPEAVSGITIAVPRALVEAYKQSDLWKGCTVTAMEDRAFPVNDIWYGCDLDKSTATVSYDKILSLDNYSGIESVAIPAKLKFAGYEFEVTSVGDKAFDHSWALREVSLPETLTAIDNSAFAYCTSLRSVDVPAAVTTIGSEAFTGCSGLADVTLHDGLEAIGSYAFFGCTGLNEITVPETVTTIGDRAFMGVNWVKDVYANGQTPSEAPVSAFSESAYHNATLHVPAGTLGLYEAHPTWSKFLKIKEDPGSVVAIEGVEADQSGVAEEIFTLSGVRAGDRDTLAPGIYISRRGSRVEKIIIR